MLMPSSEDHQEFNKYFLEKYGIELVNDTES